MTRAALFASAALAASLLACGGASAQSVALAANDLSRLSIEELANLEVTSVSKHPESLAHAPAAIYALTNDDIRRSGAQTLPEVLQLAPNLEVMRVDALDYTISARGFGGFEAANKLLVLVDGRSVYTPLYGGVDWDQHHVVLDDVDQIEVISGPGGALWGVNAVNGVINVRTKSAYDTQGLLFTTTAGTLDSDIALRYGGQIGEGPAWRVYATGYRRGDLKSPAGGNANDGWEGLQGGFRADWTRGSDTFTLQGDLADNNIDTSLGADGGYVRAANVLGRWSRALASGASFEIQTYVDRAERQARLTFDRLDNWDIDAQFSFAPGDRHHIILGGGYRYTEDQFRTLSEPQLLSPFERNTSIANLFVQDEIALRQNLSLTLGVKWEENSYTGAEWLPNARLAWRLNDDHLLWAAVSRAARNPSRIERDFIIAGVVEPGFFQPEHLTAYEVGYRSQPAANTSLSVSLFYHDYSDLRTNDLSPGGVLPIRVSNTMRGETHGAEVAAAWDVTDRWRLSGGFTLLDKTVELEPGSLDIAGFEGAGVDPRAWVKVRSEFAITDTLDLDLRLRHYEDVPTLTAVGYSGAPSYTQADARLAWRIAPDIELSLVGQNLLDSQHPEASETRRSEIPRSVFAGLRWTY
jgi:iron complex outermembrane receptor protein